MTLKVWSEVIVPCPAAAAEGRPPFPRSVPHTCFSSCLLQLWFSPGFVLRPGPWSSRSSHGGPNTRACGVHAVPGPWHSHFTMPLPVTLLCLWRLSGKLTSNGACTWLTPSSTPSLAQGLQDKVSKEHHAFLSRVGPIKGQVSQSDKDQITPDFKKY